MPMLNNFSANMSGFNSPSSYPSNVGTAPSTIGGGAPQSPFAPSGAMSPTLGGSGMGNPYNNVPNQGMPPPPPMNIPNSSTMTNTPPPMGQQATPQQPPGMLPANSGSPNATPATNGMLSAEQQALMNELQSGAIGSMQSSPLVSQNAPQVAQQNPTFANLTNA